MLTSDQLTRPVRVLLLSQWPKHAVGGAEALLRRAAIGLPPGSTLLEYSMYPDWLLTFHRHYSRWTMLVRRLFMLGAVLRGLLSRREHFDLVVAGHIDCMLPAIA